MEVQDFFCMKGGDGEDSYARNSLLQRAAMLKVKPILEESLIKLYTSKLPECLVMADLGCGSGPNTLLLVGEVIDIILRNCRRLKTKPPVLQALLNDLPSNDFDSIFNSLPSFYEKLKRESGNEEDRCFVSATVGSFYGRLFPPNSLHFVHSSYCLHWRSKVPEELGTENGTALNKGHIYLGKNSNERLIKLYLDLFKTDLWSFLRSRSVEMINGGTIVLTLAGRPNQTLAYHIVLELLTRCFQDMGHEGEIEEVELDSFNVPFYNPTETELTEAIANEVSFTIRRMQIFKQDWDPRETLISNQCLTGQHVSKIVRAINESVIASHFRHQILDGLFERSAQKVDEYEEVEKEEFDIVVVSLTKS